MGSSLQDWIYVRLGLDMGLYIKPMGTTKLEMQGYLNSLE